MKELDVIVVGAGIAGLAAARTLAEAGLRVLVLESRDRIGGRIHTLRSDGQTIELGAEFIHGRPPELWSLIEEAGLETYERTGSHVSDDDSFNADDEDDDPTFAPLEALKDYAGPDCSFVEYLERSGVPEEDRQAAIGYVEGFNAVDATQASALALGVQQRAEDAIEGDRLWRIAAGYDRLPQFLADRILGAGGTIGLSHAATGIEWRQGMVKIATAAGVFHARKAVIALPLGVLQSRRPRFMPEPAAIFNAADQLRDGVVCRLTLAFRTAFWKPLAGFEDLSFLMTRWSLPRVWWTTNPEVTPTLTGWAGGPRAAELLALSRDELTQRACRILADTLRISPATVEAELQALHMHDWQADPQALGAYTWIPAGSLDVPEQMATPVEDTLYFAGEHTDTTGHWGTVHAALGSGLRAARQILNG